MQLPQEIPLLLGRSARRGFTLVEMLIVLTIVIVLTLLAMPSLLSTNQENNTTMTAQNLYYALQFARSQALKSNSTVYVNFQTGTNWCYGINVGSNCTCSLANSCSFQTVTAPASEATSLSATGLSSGSLTFEPTHGAAGQKSIVTFTANTSAVAMAVEVMVMGDSLLCSTTIGGYSACP
jgi:type IV fimbrial biogenesis protein FimT